MKPHYFPAVGGLFCSLLLMLPPGLAVALDPDQALHDWQLRRLMEPLQVELEKERKGSVYIYDGLNETEVEKALNTHFDRIQYMMFMGTVRTDTRGEPLRDASGNPVRESGGCSAPD